MLLGQFVVWGESGTICCPKNAGGTICCWDKMSPNREILYTIFVAIETREFSQRSAKTSNMEAKANKSNNCLLQHVRLLACLNICGSNTYYFYFTMSAFLWVSAIVEASSTTTLSITSPPTHAPSFFSRLAGRVVDFIISPDKIRT